MLLRRAAGGETETLSAYGAWFDRRWVQRGPPGPLSSGAPGTGALLPSFNRSIIWSMIKASEPVEIGAYEAKSRLPEYLRQVREGRRFVITQRGEPVAELVPVGAVERLRATRAATELLAFVRESPRQTVDLKALIEEGRD